MLATLRRQGAPYALTPGELGERTMVTVRSGDQTGRPARRQGPGRAAGERLRPAARARVVLTSEGHRVIDAAMDEHVVNEARLLAGLDPGERAALADLLGRLATTLGV